MGEDGSDFLYRGICQGITVADRFRAGVGGVGLGGVGLGRNVLSFLQCSLDGFLPCGLDNPGHLGLVFPA